jgi:chaperonin GroES
VQGLKGKGKTMASIRPLNDRIVVERAEEEGKTAGGIIIPDDAKKPATKGTAIAIGSGRVLEDGRRVPIGVGKGDVVLFDKYAGTEIEIDGKKAVVLREDDILGIEEK